MKIRKNNEEHIITENVLANICLNLCGGGYTEAQTTEAMIMQEDLMNGKVVYDKSGNQWEVLEK